MKARLKSILIAVVILAAVVFYFSSNYIWSARTKSKVPSNWILVYEGKTRSLLPWTWFFPEPSGLWFITSPPEKLDLAITKGQKLVLVQVVSFYRNDGEVEKSEYFEVVSPDRKASDMLKDEELRQLLSGHIDQISFNWTTYKNEYAGSAMIKYCSDHAAEKAPELAPHFSTNDYIYLGSFFKNYTYISKDKDGRVVGKFSDGQYEAHIISAREKVFVLIQNPKTLQFALLDPSDSQSNKEDFSGLNFKSLPTNSILAKGWQKAKTPEAFKADAKKGYVQQWIYVDVVGETRQVDRFYVGTEIKLEPKSGLCLVPLIDVTEEQSIYFLDLKNKSFAPMACDFLWTPLDELKYRDATSGSLGEVLLNLAAGVGSK